MDIEQHSFRSKIFSAIRAFFDEAGFIEVDTPLLSPDLIPESCLEVFKTERLLPVGGGNGGSGRGGKAGDLYLVPSPEIHMKKIIAAYQKSIYQICKCFRNGESVGRMHNYEFTMLEYYTVGADYRDSVRITECLFAALTRLLPGLGLPVPDEARPPFTRMTVNEAFIAYAGFDLYEAAEKGTLFGEARKKGIPVPEGTGTPVLYDVIFVQEVEPKLGTERPLVLTDYPAFVPTLARLNPDGRTRQRWELYMRGVELANCYSEETDGAAVRQFFEEEAREKERRAIVRHAVDHDYWTLFAPENGRGFPACSGVAMGLDRLLMVLAGRKAIG
ncbi:MAG: LysR family transcriptional regulator [Spirochaetaceae bacterium]|jgi:lysyl-tRNA synthetase class 2|nr:LysR family transcriptional regulator [Spirochaetaceae bacterium]